MTIIKHTRASCIAMIVVCLVSALLFAFIAASAFMLNMGWAAAFYGVLSYCALFSFFWWWEKLDPTKKRSDQ